MVRAEPTNNRTAGIDTNHPTMFTLLSKTQRYVGTTVDTVRIAK